MLHRCAGDIDPALFGGAFGILRDICGARARPNSYVGIKETVLVPHSKDPLRKGKKYTYDLGNVVNERRALFTGKREGSDSLGPPVTRFSFELPISKAPTESARPVLHRLRVTIDRAEGATLFLRFFYGLRNILSHGDPASTFGGSLKNFVHGTDFSVGSRPDKATQVAMVEQVEGLLDQAGCQTDPGDPRDVAMWMVGKLCEFDKYRERVRISTVLLETLHGFLTAVARAYLEGLVANTRGLAHLPMWDVESLLPYS